MATDLERLVVSLEANIKGYEKALAKAQGLTNRTAKGIEDRFSKLNPNFGGFLNSFAGKFIAATAGAVGLERVIDSIRRAVKEVDDIGDTAERIGVTTDALQAFKFALAQAGGSAEIADKALDKFADAMSEAALGSGYLAKVFAANGVALKNTNGQLKTTEELLVEFARLVANTQDPINRLKLATDGFGRQAGPQMVTTLQRIAREGLPAVIDEARRFGVVLEKDVIEKGGDLEKQFVKVEAQIKKAYQEAVVAWGGQALLSAIKGIEIAFKNVAVSAQLISLGRLREALGIVTRLEAAKQKMAVGLGQPLGGDELNNFLGSRPHIDVTGRPTNLPAAGAAKADQFAQDLANMRKRIALEQAELDTIDATTEARERLKIVTELTAEAVKANTAAGLKNTEASAAQKAEINALADEWAALAVQIENAKLPLREFVRENSNVMKNVQTVAVDGLKSFEDALIDIGKGAKTAQQAFKDMAASILEDIARMLIRMQITIPIAMALNAALTGSAGVLPGGLPLGLGGIGSRAGGGPVRAGSPYLVGEKGPELFVPKSAGQIVANGKLGPSVIIHQTIDARGSMLSEGRVRQIVNEGNNQLRREILPITREGRSRKIA